MKWTTPKALRDRIQRLWDRGDFLSARLSGTSSFPLEIRLKRPRPRQIAEHFGSVMDWVNELRANSRPTIGHGYDLRFEQVNNRVQGSNAMPTTAIFATEADALRFIRRQAEADRAEALATTIIARQPKLRDWVIRRPFVMLEHQDEWDRLLAVLDWFLAHPAAGLYLRQLDIPGVDTKFIEARRGILSELLDAVLPEDAIDASVTGIRNFSLRYGLRPIPTTVQFRLLDASLYIHGLSDLTVPVEQFAQLDLPVTRVFITENRTNGLAFPDCPESLVIFGLGYAVEQLADIPWLQHKDVWYWGDLDTHGFRILDQLRANLPQARSFLMDRATLEAHVSLSGSEPADKRYTGELYRLTADEHALFDDLRHDRLGERVRLEQERIRYGWVQQVLREITGN